MMKVDEWRYGLIRSLKERIYMLNANKEPAEKALELMEDRSELKGAVLTRFFVHALIAKRREGCSRTLQP